jgi:hypothetical protein
MVSRERYLELSRQLIEDECAQRTLRYPSATQPLLFADACVLDEFGELLDLPRFANMVVLQTLLHALRDQGVWEFVCVRVCVYVCVRV